MRAAALAALEQVPMFATHSCPEDTFISSRLWLARTDPDAENRQVADRLWDVYGHGLNPQYLDQLLPLLSIAESAMRSSVATALAAGVKELQPDNAQTLLKRLFVAFVDALPAVAQKEGKIKDPASNTRSGVALTLQASAEDGVLSQDDVIAVFDFLLKTALTDPNTEVRQQLVQAGVDIINTHPTESINLLMPKFDSVLTSSQEQKVREAVVVFLGAVGQHLPEESPKVSSIVDSLIEGKK